MSDGPELIRRMLERSKPIPDPILSHRKPERPELEAVGVIAHYVAVSQGQVSRELIIPEVSTTVALSDIQWKFGIDKARAMVDAMKDEIARIDTELEPGDDIFQAAVLLKASTKFGQNERALELLTGYSSDLVRQVKRGARSSGIWNQGARGRYASVDGADWETKPMNLMIDACAALGRLRRRPR